MGTRRRTGGGGGLEPCWQRVAVGVDATSSPVTGDSPEVAAASSPSSASPAALKTKTRPLAGVPKRSQLQAANAMPTLLGAAVRLLLVLALTLSAVGETVHHYQEYQASESAALLSWKRSLGDPVALSTWTEDSTACDAWRGVVCDAAGHVMSIRLGNVGLSGSLALDLAAFPALAEVDLHWNNLGGAIPPEFVRGRSNISYLDLSSNEFTGPIPDGLPKSLKYLNLSDNAFTGPIPGVTCEDGTPGSAYRLEQHQWRRPQFLGRDVAAQVAGAWLEPPWGAAPPCFR